MDFWIGFFLGFYIPLAIYVLLCFTRNVVYIPYSLKNKVYCIGDDNVIYLCEAVGCGYHEDDGQFYYHFLCCTDHDIGWAYSKQELYTEVFYTHSGAEKALKKRNISDD